MEKVHMPRPVDTPEAAAAEGGKNLHMKVECAYPKCLYILCTRGSESGPEENVCSVCGMDKRSITVVPCSTCGRAMDWIVRVPPASRAFRRALNRLVFSGEIVLVSNPRPSSIMYTSILPFSHTVCTLAKLAPA